MGLVELYETATVEINLGRLILIEAQVNHKSNVWMVDIQISMPNSPKINVNASMRSEFGAKSIIIYISGLYVYS